MIALHSPESQRIASYILISEGATMRWICRIFTISGSAILSYSPTATTISTALRNSGVKLSGICKNSMLFQMINLVYVKKCKWRFNNSDPSRQLLLPRQWVQRQLKYLCGSAPFFGKKFLIHTVHMRVPFSSNLTSMRLNLVSTTHSSPCRPSNSPLGTSYRLPVSISFLSLGVR